MLDATDPGRTGNIADPCRAVMPTQGEHVANCRGHRRLIQSATSFFRGTGARVYAGGMKGMDLSEAHVLVVDDHRDIRDPLAAYLRRHAGRVSVAADAAAARGIL